jgi:transcription elongation GreA/GreB family factor
MTIERKIFETSDTINSYKASKGPLQKVQQQSENIQNHEMKRLMTQNEKLIQELNQLRRVSVTMSPEKIKRGDPKDIFHVKAS